MLHYVQRLLCVETSFLPLLAWPPGPTPTWSHPGPSPHSPNWPMGRQGGGKFTTYWILWLGVTIVYGAINTYNPNGQANSTPHIKYVVDVISTLRPLFSYSVVVQFYTRIYFEVSVVDPILCRVVSLEKKNTKTGIKLKWHKIVFMPVRHIVGDPLLYRFGIKSDEHTKRKYALCNTRPWTRVVLSMFGCRLTWG